MKARRPVVAGPQSPLKRIALPRPNFVPKTAKDSKGRRRKYVVYVLPGYTANRAWPAILYLHGIGERGTDGCKQCSIGIGPAIVQYGRPFPFIVMFPQCIEFDRADDDLAMTILDKTCYEYSIDAGCVYLSGLSTGGAGTWRLATRYPERFAAIAPILWPVASQVGREPHAHARVVLPRRCRSRDFCGRVSPYDRGTEIPRSRA